MFRVFVDTFYYLCELVVGDLETHPPMGLGNLPNRYLGVRKQVALALRRLATGDGMLVVGEMFGVSETTGQRVCRRFTKAIVCRGHHHLKWPEPEEVEAVKAGFAQSHSIPQCVGAIDCTHIPLDLPAHASATDWYDRDHNYSMILQAIVDSKMRFIDAFAGFPGSVHDARVYGRSKHCELVASGQRLNGPMKQIYGVDIPEMVIGDAGYATSEHMLVPWTTARVNPLYDEYNFKHSSTRMVVERAFGVLKGMWRTLRRSPANPDLTQLPRTIITCCILHNVIIDRRDQIDDDIPLVGHHDDCNKIIQRSE